ncbi:hypothetical protein DSL72_000012 [Monilinia vaccinii-corymbosi]|uniref:Arabinanase/levansucrase/invertase n=1 Tax=Monilinia vaccinii-corymbosi TaxID=61207 RepID=A0A8A3P850_9HELO|nr:hypothetical protein DSL72_000012 [Monilinia vaccinii-corymbosi]
MRNSILSSLLWGSSLLGVATCLDTTISNSFVNMFTSDGDHIDSTSGKMDYFEGQYHWYGLNFGCGKKFCGIESWSSVDLINWSSNGLLFDPTESEMAKICEGAGNCGRPHIVYNPPSSQYILWLNAGSPGYLIMTSYSPTSGYALKSTRALLGHQPHPQTEQGGDFSVAVIDGTGYIAYSLIDFAALGASIWPPFTQSIYVQKLTDDFMNTTGNATVVRPVGDLVDDQTESPDIFYRDGYYYISASNTCGFCQGTILIMYRAKQIAGPWTRQIISGDTCGGQSNGVLTIPSSTGGDGVYIHQADIQASAPLAGPRNAQHGHQFQVLNFNSDGSVRDLNCSASLTTTVKLPDANTTTIKRPTTKDIAKNAALGSGNHHQDYYLNCSLPQNSLYQTFTSSKTGNLATVGVNLAGDAPTDNVTLTVFRYTNATALLSPFYKWETLSTLDVTPSDLNAALRSINVPVGKQIVAGDKLGIAIVSLGITPVCVAMRGTTHAYAAGWAGPADGGFVTGLDFGDTSANGPGSGGALYVQGANQVSLRGKDGDQIPIRELEGREVKWFGVVE